MEKRSYWHILEQENEKERQRQHLEEENGRILQARLREQEEAQRRQQEEARRQARELLHARLYDNARLFLRTQGEFVYDPEGTISSRQLYARYRAWCIREGLPVKPPREFFLHAKQEAPHHGISYSGNVVGEDGRRCRGFRGIRVPDGNG